MKKILSYSILILAAVLMSSCSGLNKMKQNAGLVKYDVNPKVLEAHAGVVNVEITGTFPESYFDKKTTLTATPVITYAGGETVFDQVQVVQGESVQANNPVITYNGGTFRYNSSVPYKDDMKVSELILRVKAVRGAKSLDFDPVKLADGVIATSALVNKHARSVPMKDKFERIVPESEMADIHYVINQYNIRNTELKAEDVVKLQEYIDAVNEDPNREFKGAAISSYASPDGGINLNTRLSGNRGTAADRLLQKEFSDVEDAKTEGFFDSKTTPEDWEGFRTEVENSSIQDKDLILRVLSMYSDPEVREKEIKNMSAAYEVLKTDILPKLRRSKMIVSVDKIGRSDEEILALAKSDPKALSLEELLYAGTLTDNLDEKLAIYKAALENNPKCIRAANNIGYTLMAQGKTDAAIAAYEVAKAINNTDVIKNNLAFCYLVKGNMERAEELFTSMTAATDESKWGMGVISITKGEYDKAVNFFGTEPCFNAALAQLLKNDVNKAKVTLDSAESLCPDGRGEYLKAVVGARLENRDYMLNGLREAVAKDTKWKEYAKTDLELAKFWNDDTFKSVVQ